MKPSNYKKKINEVPKELSDPYHTFEDRVKVDFYNTFEDTK